MSCEAKMVSFIEYAPDSDFPISNLPYGVFTSPKNVSSFQSIEYCLFYIGLFRFLYTISGVNIIKASL